MLVLNGLGSDAALATAFHRDQTVGVRAGAEPIRVAEPIGGQDLNLAASEV